jgi:hypothetical protein
MRIMAALGIGLLLASVVACSSGKPVAIRQGDLCEETHQPIQDVRIAAEIVPTGGSPALKFCTVSDMAKYLEDHDSTSATMFVTDYPTGRLIPVETAVFVKAPAGDASKALQYHAFENVNAAVAFGEKNGEATTDWPSIRAQAGPGK